MGTRVKKERVSKQRLEKKRLDRITIKGTTVRDEVSQLVFDILSGFKLDRRSNETEVCMAYGNTKEECEQ